MQYTQVHTLYDIVDCPGINIIGTRNINIRSSVIKTLSFNVFQEIQEYVATFDLLMQSKFNSLTGKRTNGGQGSGEDKKTTGQMKCLGVEILCLGVGILCEVQMVVIF